MLVGFSISGRTQRVRRNLSHTADTAATSVSQRVSACSETNSSISSTQSRHTDRADTKRYRIRSEQTAYMNHQSDETSVESFTTNTLAEDNCEKTVSDNSRSSRLLGKSSTGKGAVIKNSGSITVVDQSTSAVAATSAAAAACFVVLKPLSSVQRVTRNAASADSHNGQTAAAVQGRRRKCQSADSDVEPDDPSLTSSSTASCKCCQ